MDLVQPGIGVDNNTLKTVTFTGAAGVGAVGDVPLFTVTGDIMVVSFVPVCTTSLTENGATSLISLGVTDIVALFIANTEPEDIDDNDIWTAIAPVTTAEALPDALQNIIVNGDANDILATCVTDTTTAGVINFYLRWYALSGNASVVAA